jgi:NADPH-dependent ferric siderophore reductase
VPVSTEVVDLDVVATRRLSPSMVRVELRGAVPSLGVPDEACVLQFPEPGGKEPVEGSGRWYTVRRIDGAGLTVDIVVHPGGSGGEWAAVGRAGDRLRRTHGNSWFRRPEGVAWQLLAGDVTALPADRADRGGVRGGRPDDRARRDPGPGGRTGPAGRGGHLAPHAGAGPGEQGLADAGL